MPWCRRLAGIMILTALVGALAQPASAGSATDRIREFFATVNRIITDPADERRADERLAALRPIVMEMIDFRTAARNSLGAAEWARRTPAEQTEFVTLFSNLLQTSVFGSVGGRARIDNGLTVAYVGESSDQDAVTVATTVLARRGSEIAVGYRMALHDGRWMVHDVAIDGVSLIENYAAQFHKVIQRSSYTSLVGEMRARLAELGRGTALASAPIPAMPVVTDAPVSVGRAVPRADETPAPDAQPTLVADATVPAPLPRADEPPRLASSAAPVFVGTMRIADAMPTTAPVETPSTVGSVSSARRTEPTDRPDARAVVATQPVDGASGATGRAAGGTTAVATRAADKPAPAVARATDGLSGPAPRALDGAATHAVNGRTTAMAHAADAAPAAGPRVTEGMSASRIRATDGASAIASRVPGGTPVAGARATGSVTAIRAADGASAAASRAGDGALVAAARATDGASTAALRAADGASLAVSRAADGALVTATRAIGGASVAGTRAADLASVPAGRAGKIEVPAPIVVAAGPTGATATARPAAAADTATHPKPRTDDRRETRPAAQTVYWVQVGAFRSDEAAISVVSALGDEPVSLLQLPDASLLRVVVGPFQTRQAAVTKLRAIRARGFDAFVAELAP